MRRPSSTTRDTPSSSGARGPTAPRRRLLRAGLLTLAWGAGVLTQATLQHAEAAPPAATSFYANFKGTKLLDQDGKPVLPERLAQHIVLINFVYTGCSSVCPLQTRALAELQSRLPRELRERMHLLSVSLDPLNDSPQVLRSFAKRMGADLSSWTFATGRPEDVEKLSDALRLFRPGTDVRKPEEHNTALWLVDAQGQLRMRYSGNPPDVRRLLRELADLDKLGHRPES